MRELTKKYPTKQKQNRLKLTIKNTTWRYDRVPISRIKKIQNELKPYETKQEENTTDWRSLLNKQTAEMDGETAYKEGAVMIKGLRARENMSQSKLATQLNIRQENLSKLENAKRPISKKMAQKLGKLFNVTYKLFL